MSSFTDNQTLTFTRAQLASLLDGDVKDLKVIACKGGYQPDFAVRVGNNSFIISLKKSSDTAAISAAITQFTDYQQIVNGGFIPILVVPYMGDVGRNLCEKAGICWIDLSGNAHIVAKGVRVHIEGRANLFKRRGRPASIFAPKSSRIIRWLLMHPDGAFSQRQLSQLTKSDEGFTSKIVRKLLEDGFVSKAEDGSVVLEKPGLLLDAWREKYDFSSHNVIRGHIAARSGIALFAEIADTLNKQAITYAATGLAAAWQYSQYASFRIASLYLADPPGKKLLATLGFREGDKGANTWFVFPNDEGVFQGAEPVNNVQCVHPIQVYLDLAGHPERAREAAEELRSTILKERGID